MKPSLRPLASTAAVALAAAWVAAANPALAQDTASPVTSRIARVTVYPGSATVERVAKVPAGARSITLGCLPASLDAQSLQINADPAVRVGEFNVRTEDRDVVAACASPLDGRIRELEDQIAAVKAEATSLQLVDGYLKSVATAGLAPKRLAAACKQPHRHRSLLPRTRCASRRTNHKPARTSCSASKRHWSWR